MDQLQSLSLAQCRQVLDQLSEGVYFVDTQRRITYWNPAAERMTGFLSSQVMGRPCSDNLLMHVDDRGHCLCKNRCPLVASMEDRESRQAEVYLHHRDGHRVPVRVQTSPIHDDCGRVIGAVELFSDNSDRIQIEQELDRLESMAYVDALTGLANRRQLDALLPVRLMEAQRTDCGLGVIMIDIDHFKKFNDAHGHAVGDLAIQLVSATLAHNARANDVVGRWGGEEFQIILTHLNQAELTRISERLRVMVAQSILTAGDRQLRMTISVGAALAVNGQSPEQLVARADAMLYQSKQAGRNRVTIAPCLQDAA